MVSTTASGRASANFVNTRHYQPATRSKRFMAAMIDGLIILLFYLTGLTLENSFIFPAGLGAILIYQAYLLTTCGQTIGKQVCGIVIVETRTGGNGGFAVNVFKRGILNLALCLFPPYAVADIVCIMGNDRRCIHDIIAGTMVREI